MSSIQTVFVSDTAGAAIISGVAIPTDSNQLIISNMSNSVYLALSELDLENEYARIEIPITQNLFRMDIPKGVGMVFVTAPLGAPPSTFISFWLA